VFAADLNTGALVQVIASNGRGPGQFCEPSGITCDSDGNFLVADSKSNRIQVSLPGSVSISVYWACSERESDITDMVLHPSLTTG